MTVAVEALCCFEIDAGSGAGRLASQIESDQPLVEKARAGDLRAFEELVRRRRNDVFALVYHFLRNREEAWDVSQEVFIKAHRALSGFRGDSSFKTWLLRIATNTCKDYVKKRRLGTVAYDDAAQPRDSPAAGMNPRESLEAQELGEAILLALDSLPAKHRIAFTLREFEGLSYEQMAHVMECSLGTVMSRLHHARRKLQAQLLHKGMATGGRH